MLKVDHWEPSEGDSATGGLRALRIRAAAGQYIEGSKEWLVADDWKFAKGTIEDAKHNLAFLQQDLTPFFYLEGELVHYSWIADQFQPTNNQFAT